MSKVKYDFGGYATKFGVRCSDGRTILGGAFEHQDGAKIPLVWNHKRKEPENVLGYAILEHRDDGMYAYCSFNDSDKAQATKRLIEHGDLDCLSIYANKLVQKATDVMHGMIREVSVVLAGANPEAIIDNLNIVHSDGTPTGDIDMEEAYIVNNIPVELKVEAENIEHSDDDSLEFSAMFDTMTDEQKDAVNSEIKRLKGLEHKLTEDSTMQEIYDSFNPIQKNFLAVMLDKIKEESKDVKHGEDLDDDKDSKSDDKNDDKNLEHSIKGGTNEMAKKRVFEGDTNTGNELSHSEVLDIMEQARKGKVDSFKEFLTEYVDTLEHAGDYGIDDIEFLFPDAQKLMKEPDFIKRRTEWVNTVLSSVNTTPFSRIKTVHADITAAEARAKGYVKANQKVEEVFGLLKRVTTPQTVYKKQKLDRDDIVDITDFDVVVWLKAEMRVMLDEEVARAILIGDGRSAASEDKINEANIRPILTDDDLYSHKVTLEADTKVEDRMEAIIKARKHYKGSGAPVYYTTTDEVTDMLLIKDSTGRRIYKTVAEIAEFLRVKAIVEVEVMEGSTREVAVDDIRNVNGIIVNLKDYNVGADKGGKLAMFDDFDIDFNQYKYLLETRISGALTKPKSALVIETKQ